MLPVYTGDGPRYLLCALKIPDFKRKKLDHASPDWVADGCVFFITINTEPRGRNQLALDEVGVAVRDAAMFYQQDGRWHVHLLLLMPDHLHVLISFNEAAHSPKQLIQSWKSYLAKTQGLVWQSDYFDHRIRNDREFLLKANYIRENPVRADLVDVSSAWSFCWSAADFRA